MRPSTILFATAFVFARMASPPLAHDPLAQESPAAPPPAQAIAPAGLKPLHGPMPRSVSFVEAPPFDVDAQAIARLSTSNDPAIVELVRLMNERELRLAGIRERRVLTTDPAAILALQHEVQRIKLDFDRGWIVAQRERARRNGRDETALVFERKLADLDHRRTVLEARIATQARRQAAR